MKIKKESRTFHYIWIGIIYWAMLNALDAFFHSWHDVPDNNAILMGLALVLSFLTVDNALEDD